MTGKELIKKFGEEGKVDAAREIGSVLVSLLLLKVVQKDLFKKAWF